MNLSTGEWNARRGELNLVFSIVYVMDLFINNEEYDCVYEAGKVE